MVCGMYSPTFRLNHRLSDWPDCHLELRCQPCRDRSTVPAVKLLMSRLGNPTFAELLPRLRCQQCRAKPAPVYLVAGHNRAFCHGGHPTGPLSWSPCLVSEPCSLFGPLIALFFVPSLSSVQHGDG